MITPNWIENGEGARGLVFLHGVSGGAAGALELLPRLAAPGWRTLAWDMPGYGASEPFEAGTPEGMGAYADALVELLDAAGLERAVLVGHSMGGMVACLYAGIRPERVDRLATVDGFGLAAAYRNEDAFRQELRLAALLIPLALWLPASGTGKALMIASVLLVIIIELLNSGLEATVDRISLDQHHLAKRAKDIGSAAVFVALVNAVAVWGLVLFA